MTWQTMKRKIIGAVAFGIITGSLFSSHAAAMGIKWNTQASPPPSTLTVPSVPSMPLAVEYRDFDILKDGVWGGVN